MIKSSHMIWFGLLMYFFIIIFGVPENHFYVYWGFWNTPSHIFSKYSYYILYLISQVLIAIGIFADITNYIGRKLSM